MYQFNLWQFMFNLWGFVFIKTILICVRIAQLLIYCYYGLKNNVFLQLIK